MSEVVLFGRPNCPMCDEAREALEGSGTAFDEVDISQEQSLEDEYGRFVPVVEARGRIVFHAGMNPADLPDLVRENL